jgi:Domain of unknown function (DUF4159)
MGASAGAGPGGFRRQLVAALVVVVLAASLTAAQRLGGLGRRPVLAWATPESMDTGAFQFCRLVFRQASNGDGHGWSVDFPRADENLSIRFSELTRAPISTDEGGRPNHVLIRLTQAELFRCPFVMMTEPGGAYFDDREASALRDYVLKGGFFWADDFWGEYAWQVWESQLRKALPSGEYRIVDLTLDHPIFHMLMRVPEIPQIPGLGVWLSTGGTSERGAGSAVPHIRAINDARGRIMVLMTHNSDYGDGFEEEGSDRSFFERFSVRAYGFGVNALLYSMTH